MLYGKVIKAACFSRVQLFCPDLVYKEYIPLYGDSYIIDVPTYSASEFKKRFKKSVLLAASGYDIDLTNKTTAIRILNKVRKVSLDAIDYFRTLDDELEFWNAIKIYRICGKYRYEEILKKYSIYPLFFHLGTTWEALLEELYKLKDVPTEVIFSALFTFIVKMQNIDNLRGVSWRYRRDLIDVRARITDVKKKVYRYLTSERYRSDLMYFVLSL